MQEASLGAYEAMPVSAFGMAMMWGMGWKEGMSVGKNPPKEVGAEAACCSIPEDCCTTPVQHSCSAKEAPKLSACCWCMSGNLRLTGCVCDRR